MNLSLKKISDKLTGRFCLFFICIQYYQTYNKNKKKQADSPTRTIAHFQRNSHFVHFKNALKFQNDLRFIIQQFYLYL
jgi:hypothetical protein